MDSLFDERVCRTLFLPTQTRSFLLRISFSTRCVLGLPAEFILGSVPLRAVVAGSANSAAQLEPPLTALGQKAAITSYCRPYCRPGGSHPHPPGCCRGCPSPPRLRQRGRILAGAGTVGAPRSPPGAGGAPVAPLCRTWWWGAPFTPRPPPRWLPRPGAHSPRCPVPPAGALFE